jgi:hypothetical protein
VTYTGAGEAVWTVPALAPGTTVTFINESADRSGRHLMDPGDIQWLACYRPHILYGSVRSFLWMPGGRVRLIGG